MTLLEHHSDYLKARGIVDNEIITSRGYQSITDPDDLVSLGFSITQAGHVPGLLLPIFNSTGTPQGYEYRADVPRMIGDRTIKFDRPFGQSAALNVLPTMSGPLRSGHGLMPLIIVEGVTRADVLAHHGIPAAAIMGIWGFKGDKGNGPAVLSELHELPIKGRAVWIFPDGDATTKPGVNSGVRALSEVFTRRGAAQVMIGVVPDNMGLDDWFASGGTPAELQGLLIAAKDLPVVSAPRKSTADIASDLPLTNDRDLAVDWSNTGAQVAFLPEFGSWAAYVGGRWQNDPSGTLASGSLGARLATVGEGYLANATDAEEIKLAGQVHHDLKSNHRLRAVQGMASSLSEFHAADSEFDQDPWLFNCANGTLDLKTGTLRAHDPADKLRGISPVSWDPEAPRPSFDKFIGEVLPDPETRAYLQQILGCALIGKPVLHLLPVFMGSGRNGKGTLVRALTAAFGGDYAGAVDKSLLISTKFESHPTKLMALKGKRMVFASETEAGDRFASASLKMLTGGDEISARGMRQDQQTFMPSHSMVLMTNNLPEVDALDRAMWARLRLIRFTADFEGREDHGLDDRLHAEAPGILRWLVEGLMSYHMDGLMSEPLSVLMATGDWQMDENTFLSFANDQLVKDPSPRGVISAGDLLAAYTKWCDLNDVEALRARAFGSAVKAYGATARKSNGTRGWGGIRLRVGSEDAGSDRRADSDGIRPSPIVPLTSGNASETSDRVGLDGSFGGIGSSRNLKSASLGSPEVPNPPVSGGIRPSNPVTSGNAVNSPGIRPSESDPRSAPSRYPGPDEQEMPYL